MNHQSENSPGYHLDRQMLQSHSWAMRPVYMREITGRGCDIIFVLRNFSYIRAPSIFLRAKQIAVEYSHGPPSSLPMRTLWYRKIWSGYSRAWNIVETTAKIAYVVPGFTNEPHCTLYLPLHKLDFKLGGTSISSRQGFFGRVFVHCPLL